MVKYFISLTLIFGIHVKPVSGQTIVSIQTDRPDQTECPFIVPAKHFQVESGFVYEKADEGENRFFYPSALIKYGVNARFELRVVTELITVNNSAGKASGINPVKIGFKTKLFDEKGILPATSFIAHLSAPVLSAKKLRTTYYAPDFRFTMQHTITNKISIAYNLGAAWDGETATPAFLYTFTCGYSVLPKAGVYVELFGFAPQTNKSDHRFDGGITYFIQPNFMIDVSGSVGLTANAPAYYASLGLSVRLPD